MGNVVDIASDFRFTPCIAKVVEESTREIKQRCFIALKSKSRNLCIVSPVTSLVGHWKGSKYSTQYKYMTIICHMLNYLYFEKRYITDITEIDSDMVAAFIDDYGKNHTRRDTMQHYEIIKKSMYYVAHMYPGLIKVIDISDFMTNGKRVVWGKVESKILFPSAVTDRIRKQNKNTDLEFGEVIRLLEICLELYPNCVFGLYLAFFGGLRLSEVTHITIEDIPLISRDTTSFSICVKDKIISPTARNTDIYQSKINRPRTVFIFKDVFWPLYEMLVSNVDSGAIIRNRFGEPMSQRGFSWNFSKCKAQLINELKNGDEVSRLRAYELEHTTWGTHIGRGVFSNLIADYSEQPYILALLRGDSSYVSSMPYLVDNEETINAIQKILEDTYNRLPRNNEEKDS